MKQQSTFYRLNCHEIFRSLSTVSLSIIFVLILIINKDGILYNVLARTNFLFVHLVGLVALLFWFQNGERHVTSIYLGVWIQHVLVKLISIVIPIQKLGVPLPLYS